jgi:hypothetical protein
MKTLSLKYSIRKDWYGVLIKSPLTYEIKITPEKILHFSSTLPWHPSKVSPAKCGEYVEALRDFDVTELFLALDNGSYLEFNFAAGGAWWLMEFPSYRTPNRSKSYNSLAKPTIVPAIESCQWSIKATCDLSKVLTAEIVSLNCSAIQQGKIVKYYSLNALSSIEPDFHHKETYVCL